MPAILWATISSTLTIVTGSSSPALLLVGASCCPARRNCRVYSTSAAPVNSPWLYDDQCPASFTPDSNLLGVLLGGIALGAPHLVGWDQLEAICRGAFSVPLHVHQLVCALITPVGLGTAFVRAPHAFASQIGARLAHLSIDEDQASAPSDAGKRSSVAGTMGRSWWVGPFSCSHPSMETVPCEWLRWRTWSCVLWATRRSALVLPASYESAHLMAALAEPLPKQ